MLLSTLTVTSNNMIPSVFTQISSLLEEQWCFYWDDQRLGKFEVPEHFVRLLESSPPLQGYKKNSIFFSCVCFFSTKPFIIFVFILVYCVKVGIQSYFFQMTT